MTLMISEEIEKMVKLVGNLISGYRGEKNPTAKRIILENLLFYLQAKLADKHKEFLAFAFPAFAERGFVPNVLLITTDNLPELLRDFLTQSQPTSPN